MTDVNEHEELEKQVDCEKIEAAVRDILEAVGEDPNRDGLLDTPARVARMYAEITSGLREDPKEHLYKVFDVDHDEMIMVREIPVYSMCEHHLLPFHGQALLRTFQSLTDESPACRRSLVS